MASILKGNARPTIAQPYHKENKHAYVHLLTRVSSEVVRSPKSLEDLEREVMKHVQSQCPEVEWVHNFAVLGPYDYLDIFRAPDLESAFKLSALIRTFGHAYTEVWPATEWARFKDLIRHLPGV